MEDLKGKRAVTGADKKKVIEKVLEAWLKVPDLRLCQLLQLSANKEDIFYIEDLEIAKIVTDFAHERIA
jgi:uncharacterized protein YihD (DUF1040 family)